MNVFWRDASYRVTWGQTSNTNDNVEFVNLSVSIYLYFLCFVFSSNFVNRVFVVMRLRLYLHWQEQEQEEQEEKEEEGGKVRETAVV